MVGAPASASDLLHETPVIPKQATTNRIRLAIYFISIWIKMGVQTFQTPNIFIYS